MRLTLREPTDVAQIDSDEHVIPFYGYVVFHRMGMIGLRRVRLTLCLAAFTASASFCASAKSHVAIRDYLRTSWIENAGQPIPTLRALAQTPDGYLWLATSGGTLRFDGLRFSEWPFSPGNTLPAATTHRMAVARDGAVWLANAAGLARVHDGIVRVYPRPLAGHTVDALFEGPSGEIWFLANTRDASAVWVLDPATGNARAFGHPDGLPLERIRSIAYGHGRFWLGVEGATCRWNPGSRADCRAVSGAVLAIAVTASEVYAATRSEVYRYAPDGTGAVFARAPEGGILPGLLLPDRYGKLWVGTGTGLLLVDAGGAETFSAKDHLSGEFIEALLEDAEGDIWVGTNNGLDRFRRPRVLHLTTADGLSREMVTCIKATRDGSVWVGAMGPDLNRIVGGKVVRYTKKDGLPPSTVMAMQEDAAGRLWAASGPMLTYFENGRFIPAPSPSPSGPVTSLAPDGEGVWAAASSLWRIARGVASPVAAGLPNDLFRVTPARDGALWLGSFRGGVLTLAGPDRSTVTPVQGLAAGAPRDILETDGGTMWVAAGPTLNRIRRGRITTWTAAQGLDAGEISGMVSDRAGNLWLSTVNAVLRIPLAELDRSPDGRPESARFAAVVPRDGLRPKAVPGMGYPFITAAPDGRVWLCERDGVGVLDPDLLRDNPVPPPVVIEDVEVDGVSLHDRAPRFRGRQLQIAYTGNSLMAPERVRFRYRLEPGDSRWIEAETRRDVTFVGLAPGDYRFHVTACNLDDICNEAGAALAFQVMPFYYQTLWFRVLAIAALGSMVWGAYKLRMRRLVARYQLVAQERARVTREIHDSLLQGFAGVVLQLDAASRQFDANPTASKDRLDRALNQADDSLREARQMLLDMRLPILEDKTVAEALAEVGANATRGTSISFHVKTRGSEKPLPYSAQAALFLIGREAITNAVNHAGPSYIAVHVTASEKNVRLVVQDDGAGFDLDAARRKAGHLGVTGMGERAKQAGAEFRIDTAPGAGTRIEVVVRCKRM